MSKHIILVGDALAKLQELPSDLFQCVVTSPPYWGLRDYGVEGQIGAEDSPYEFVEKLVAVFREVRRVLRKDGTLWLNLGDSYCANRTYQVPSTMGGKKHSVSQSSGGKGSKAPEGLKAKDLAGVPWRVALALQADGWYLRSDCIWAKPNPMPESVKDRPTRSHEYVFLLSKAKSYYYDVDAVREPHAHPEQARKKVANPNKGRKSDYSKDSGRNDGNLHTSGVGFPSNPDLGKNMRSVWTITPKPYKGAHFATMPIDLAEKCIKASCPVEGFVLDPFGGAGTTSLAAGQLGRSSVIIELNPAYAEQARDRLNTAGLDAEIL